MKAFFPGTFDPITNGHLDVIARAARLFEQVVVGVHSNPGKRPFFSLEERQLMAAQSLAHVANVQVVGYDGLTVDYAKGIDADAIIRGLRAISDFEYEFALATMNRSIDPDIQTVCLLTSKEYAFVSSSLVREVAVLGQSVDEWVPPPVASRIRAKLAVGKSGTSLRE